MVLPPGITIASSGFAGFGFFTEQKRTLGFRYGFLRRERLQRSRLGPEGSLIGWQSHRRELLTRTGIEDSPGEDRVMAVNVGGMGDIHGSRIADESIGCQPYYQPTSSPGGASAGAD